MIVVALGTEQFPFPRILEWVETAIEEGIIPGDEKIFVQAGNTKFVSKFENVEIFSLIPYQELYEKYREARINIVHAGIGTFLDILELDKVPLIVPRLPELNEHKDGHQKEFAESAQKEMGIPVAWSYEEFKSLVANFAQKCKIRSTKKQLTDFLDQQILN